MKRKKQFELITIGTELTNGSTINTNGYWLAKEIRKHGGTVNRITMISDDLKEIKSVIDETIKRNPDFIITTGGLGPTPDDKTFEGVAKALELKIRIDKRIADLIKQKYNNFKIPEQNRLIKFRLKMARIPENSEIIVNKLGTAPGIIIKKNSVAIICLPGVPNELKKMFRSIINNLIKPKYKNQSIHKEINYKIECDGEVSLIPLIKRLKKKYGSIDMYIKTHPQKMNRHGHNNYVRFQIIICSDEEKIKNVMFSIDKEIKNEMNNLCRN